MKRKDILPLSKRKGMFYKYVAFLLLLSLAIGLMPLSSSYSSKSRILPFCVGIMLWGSLIGTAIMAIAINNSRRKCRLFNKEYKSSIKTLGLINFFSNKGAVFADILVAIALLGTIVSFIFSKIYFLFIFFALFAFSFGMHCMLNGINYIYINFNAGRELES